MMADYQGVNCQVFSGLFQKYCTTCHGCQTSDFRSKVITGCYTACNKSARRCLGLISMYIAFYCYSC